jgi:hypothetical protein
MSVRLIPATKHSLLVEITVAKELNLSADDVADKLFEALAPEIEVDPIFGELRTADGHEALLRLGITHEGVESTLLEFPQPDGEE